MAGGGGLTDHHGASAPQPQLELHVDRLHRSDYLIERRVAQVPAPLRLGADRRRVRRRHRAAGTRNHVRAGRRSAPPARGPGPRRTPRRSRHPSSRRPRQPSMLCRKKPLGEVLVASLPAATPCWFGHASASASVTLNTYSHPWPEAEDRTRAAGCADARCQPVGACLRLV